MRIALVFSLLALVLAWLGLDLGPAAPLAYALLWPGAASAILAVAYFGTWPGLLGKRADGRIAWWALALGLPLFAVSVAIWRLREIFEGERASDEVAPGIHVGRWPRAAEVEGMETIVDLTAEFPARAGVREHPGYRLHPLLDTTCPEAEGIEAIVRPLVDAPDPVLIHCAVGHGRSATIAAALGLARGVFRDPDQAIAAMQQVRPGISPRAEQRRRLWSWFETTKSQG